MNTTYKYSALLPPATFLAPGPSMIDGRTEQDRLSFLCNYASLINFYNNNNELAGNWEPFLLKDPVFLLAAISKTPFTDIRSKFNNTCNELEQFTAGGAPRRDINRALNQVFGEIAGIFRYIKKWVYFMQRADDAYDLRTYVIHNARNNYSQYMWAFVSLRHALISSHLVKWSEPDDDSRLYFYDTYERQVWEENRDREPFWEVLGLNSPYGDKDKSENDDTTQPIKNNDWSGILHAIRNGGDKVMTFFGTIIQHAGIEFGKLKDGKGQYPDTTLLRTFVNLLKTQQDQLNGLTQKHLRFYYKDILLQAELPAKADSVFLCSELAKPTAVFTLPAGTQFNAGTDAQKKPIFFSNPVPVALNPGTVVGGCTLSVVPTGGIGSSLCLDAIPAPGVLQKAKDGKLQSWQTFGGPATSQSTLVNPGFAFASPMLFLLEGYRKITLEMDFELPIDIGFLQNVTYYLSTQKKWFEVKGNVEMPADAAPLQSHVAVTIKLNPIDPPIESFLINPDGLDSSWPMLKVEFRSFSDLVTPPVLKSITVSVDVKGAKSFQLYNDYGLLTTKSPYPPFGPMPLANSNFVIGSSEIFSKPLTSLIIELSWNNPPANFSDYYQQYNTYIDPPPPPPPGCSLIRKIKRWFRAEASVQPPVMFELFNDTCFKVDFSLLQNGNWDEFAFMKMEKNPDASGKPKFIPYHAASQIVPLVGKNIVLFSEDSDGNVTDSSIFGYFHCPPPKPKPGTLDPGIQARPLKFTDSSKWGFMRMTLSHPKLGFGSTIYPNVVSNIALNNAQVIVNDEGTISQPASLPYAPELISFTANYKASVQYVFNATIDYPIQCFQYTPFKNYTVFDNINPPADHTYVIGNSVTSASTVAGVPLWPSFNYAGYLFLQVSNLLPCNALSFYFELARSYGGTNNSAAKANYFYIGKDGWSSISSSVDGTNNFSCSGTVKLAIPDDVTAGDAAMPQKNYWLAIAVEDDPSLYAQTVFLKTNGFIANRTSALSSVGNGVPQLAANTITKTQSAVPQMGATIQPFSSFGGKAPEGDTAMMLRVSNRLKTKDRAVTPEDYFRLVTQEFDDIYYAKPVFDALSKTIGVYLVKACSTWSEPNAFTPMLSRCREDKIAKFLNNRVSVFYPVVVSGFDFQSVRITATVVVADGFDSTVVKSAVIGALDIFLSPWITSDKAQVVIGRDITDADASNFIGTLPGVTGVTDVSLQTWMGIIPPSAGIVIPAQRSIAPMKDTVLMVSSMDHVINF